MITMTPRQASLIYRVERLNSGEVACSSFSPVGKHLVRHHVRHSPDGFETGYGGSGPADLARSILIDFFGSDVFVDQIYHDF